MPRGLCPPGADRSTMPPELGTPLDGLRQGQFLNHVAVGSGVGACLHCLPSSPTEWKEGPLCSCQGERAALPSALLPGPLLGHRWGAAGLGLLPRGLSLVRPPWLFLTLAQ